MARKTAKRHLNKKNKTMRRKSRMHRKARSGGYGDRLFE
jgi:hypothetical protein